MALEIKCACGECVSSRGTQLRFYRCAGCKRLAPWCFGAADDMPEHCDDCWAEAHKGAARRKL